MTLMIAIILGLAAAPPTSTTPPAAKKNADDQDKVVCKSVPELGSLVRKKRTCMSRRDWRIQSMQANDALNDVSRDR